VAALRDPGLGSEPWPPLMPAYDEERVLAELLRGLQDAAGTSPFEIVVVCNGCTDRSADVAGANRPSAIVIETDTASK